MHFYEYNSMNLLWFYKFSHVLDLKIIYKFYKVYLLRKDIYIYYFCEEC